VLQMDAFSVGAGEQLQVVVSSSGQQFLMQTLGGGQVAQAGQHQQQQVHTGLDIKDCPLAWGQLNLAVRQADLHASLPDGQPNVSHF
jgi:hypothetical protein